MRIALVLCLFASVAAAQDAAPPTAPLSAPRPEERPAGPATEAGGADAPVEEAVPDAEAEEAAAEPADPPIREQRALSQEDLAACLGRLDALGVSYAPTSPILDPEVADCGIEQPITVDEVLPGLAIEPPATLRCETAEALAHWARTVLLPAAERLPERGALVSIRQGTGYYCRPRNDEPGGRLSEHAFGNAVDLMAFVFESGDPIAVQPREREGTMAEAFQDAVRAGACLWFTTVLGPGADADHADHLHLDILRRENGFRLCQ